MSKVVHFNKSMNIPVIAEPEVLVIGGGPGGLSAAVMAARSGADVTLVERCGSLGGTANFAEITPFMPSHSYVTIDGKEARQPFDGPIYTEWVDQMHSYLSPELKDKCTDSEYLSSNCRIISKDLAALAAEDLCLDAGVNLLFGHTFITAVVEENKIEYLVFNSKSGLVAIKAQIYIDSTGDGDVAANAGFEFKYGDENSGICQPMTLCFKLSHVDINRIPENLNDTYHKAQKTGEISCKRENVLRFNYYDSDVVHFNTTRVLGLSAINGVERAKAEVEGRRQLREIWNWLRNNIAGFEKSELHSMGIEIGVRESRRIVGENWMTREDFNQSRKYPDAVVRCNYPIDIHSVTGTGTEITGQPHGEYYEIPFGCIVPKGAKNLLMGCRAISVDHALHSSSRVMPPVTSIGQAAGIAAKIAIDKKINVTKIDGLEVREKLVQKGAKL